MRRDLKRRLARLGAERVAPEAVGAAFAALDRGEQPAGKAAELARRLRANLLLISAQTVGGGALTAEVVEHVGRDLRVHAADLERAQRLLDDARTGYGDEDGYGARATGAAGLVGPQATD